LFSRYLCVAKQRSVILKITERCIAKQRKQGGAKLVFSGFAYFIKQRKGFANLVCKT